MVDPTILPGTQNWHSLMQESASSGPSGYQRIPLLALPAHTAIQVPLQIVENGHTTAVIDT
jgi:hypothetical protein